MKLFLTCLLLALINGTLYGIISFDVRHGPPQLSKIVHPHEYGPFTTLYVQQGAAAILKGSSQEYDSIATFGADPCVIFAARSPSTGDTYLAHVDALRHPKLALSQASYWLKPEKGERLEVYLASGSIGEMNSKFQEFVQYIDEYDKFVLKVIQNSADLKIDLKTGNFKTGFFQYTLLPDCQKKRITESCEKLAYQLMFNLKGTLPIKLFHNDLASSLKTDL